jgi:uncharacterized delta-60 repeat protein
MRLGKRFLLAGLWLMLAVPVFGQGVYEAWVARYNGGASALAVDDDGYVYVTGGSSGDYATIKYKPDGDTAWVRLYDSPASGSDGAYALAVDDSGNVYVTGISAGVESIRDYATIKYAPDGDTLWVRRYDGSGEYNDAHALAVDDSGYIYVTGMSGGIENGYDYATIKYAPNGDTLWVRRYDGPGDYNSARALAVDGSGNVYVTGYSWSGVSAYDYATIKYAPNGDTLWVRRYNGPANSDDQANALAVGNTGNVYVTGRSYGDAGYPDYATVKYAPNGDTLWVRRYNGPGNGYEWASALALDSGGNVYVTGFSDSIASPFGGYPDYATVKYAPNGDTLWVRRYNGPANSDDWAKAIAVDNSGNVYVTGESWGNGSFDDYATIKYAPNGNSLWVKRYNGPENFLDEPCALALDTFGNVYVTGYSEGTVTPIEWATIKYSPCTDSVPQAGDVDSSATITLGDIIHLLNYLFDRDNPPCIGIDPGNCWDFGLTCRGDVNNSASITLGDVVHLLNYVFDRDKPPCVGTDPGNCWTPVASGACCLAVPGLKVN